MQKGWGAREIKKSSPLHHDDFFKNAPGPGGRKLSMELFQFYKEVPWRDKSDNA